MNSNLASVVQSLKVLRSMMWYASMDPLATVALVTSHH
jgi:hypothetical protein